MFGKIKTPGGGGGGDGGQAAPATLPRPAAMPGKPGVPARPGVPTAPKENAKAIDERMRTMNELKTRIHRKLVEKLDLPRLTGDDATIREQVREVIVELTEREDALLNTSDRQRLVNEILDETFGLGPLEVLLSDPSISDILVNGPSTVYVERGGRLARTDVRFRDNAHLMHVIDKIVSSVGRRCDETSPMVDARLKDGSRVNAIIPPLAIDGPSLSIRRFGKDPVTWADYEKWRSCPREIAEFLQCCVKAALNILIVGGTGSGKTTLLNNLSTFIPEDDRIVTIEDAAELQLRQPHVVRLESRPPNIEGRGRITIRDLLINSLRMRPDRIVVGECRGAETLDMIQAMNTGHDGSLTTIHANSTRDALQRVETMVMMAGYELPLRAIRQQFASAVQLIVQAQRLTGGPRKITTVTEVVGMEGDMVTMQDLFTFEQLGVTQEGRAFGHFMSCGLRPSFMDRLESAGAKPDTSVFEKRILMKDYPNEK